MFTVKQLQYKIVILCTNISSVEMYKKWSEVLSNIALLGHKLIMWNVTLNSSYTSSYIINVDQNKKRKQSPRMRRRDCNLPLTVFLLKIYEACD
jgi:hypothetical protein